MSRGDRLGFFTLRTCIFAGWKRKLVAILLGCLIIITFIQGPVLKVAAFTPTIPSGDTMIASGYGNATSSRIYYWAGYNNAPVPGCFFTIDQVIENQGEVTVRITSMRYITDFTSISPTLGVPYDLTVNDGRSMTLSFPTPPNAQPGRHTLIVWIDWQYQPSSQNNWVDGDPIIVHGPFQVAQNQACKGPVQVSTTVRSLLGISLLTFLVAYLIAATVAVVAVIAVTRRRHENQEGL